MLAPFRWPELRDAGWTLFGGAPNRGLTKGWFSKRVVLADVSPERTKTRVHSDVPPERKPRTRVRSHVPKEWKPERRVHSPKPPFSKPPFVSPWPKERRRRRAEKRSSKTLKWTAQFSQLILRFSSVLRANLKRAEKKTDSPKTPFWTTISLHDAFSAPLERSDKLFLKGGGLRCLTRKLESLCDFSQRNCNDNRSDSNRCDFKSLVGWIWNH